jgi:hypothetical protein
MSSADKAPGSSHDAARFTQVYNALPIDYGLLEQSVSQHKVLSDTLLGRREMYWTHNEDH